MEKAKNICNLVTLERELYRLELEARKMEDKLDRNFDYLHDNGFSMFKNAFFSNCKRSICKEGILIRLLKRLWTSF